MGGPNVILTDYVASRWYRAPEIILGSIKYTNAIDIWSCGCILGELISGKPLFSASSTLDHLGKVFQITGQPLPEDINSVESPFVMRMMGSVQAPKTTKIKELLPDASKDATDLLVGLLRFNPSLRSTAEEALQHPYFAQFYSPEKEPKYNHLITSKLDDNIVYSINQYRKNIYAHVVRKKKTLWKMVKKNCKTAKTR